jgi:hypothetical protein
VTDARLPPLPPRPDRHLRLSGRASRRSRPVGRRAVRVGSKRHNRGKGDRPEAR